MFPERQKMEPWKVVEVMDPKRPAVAIEVSERSANDNIQTPFLFIAMLVD